MWSSESQSLQTAVPPDLSMYIVQSQQTGWVLSHIWQGHLQVALRFIGLEIDQWSLHHDVRLPRPEQAGPSLSGGWRREGVEVLANFLFLSAFGPSDLQVVPNGCNQFVEKLVPNEARLGHSLLVSFSVCPKGQHVEFVPCPSAITHGFRQRQMRHSFVLMAEAIFHTLDLEVHQPTQLYSLQASLAPIGPYGETRDWYNNSHQAFDSS